MAIPALQASLPETLIQITQLDNQGTQAGAQAVNATFGGLCGPCRLCILISLSACWPDYF
ncbi:Sugar kinase of the NBD/HSP70 family [Pseudomonas syringae pv. actinidiae]|uniref:Sugar kinase of the NBD/HSP70 family n=1 Tax=Pseudomonas syringae pv. actinidiae TaxID=103796 RepID=A0A2V0Q802_PSESF|nr:Sugar kinase of the NBD/HSP70 family [Pseudomonas syringae pv. actinidiae]